MANGIPNLTFLGLEGSRRILTPLSCFSSGSNESGALSTTISRCAPRLSFLNIVVGVALMLMRERQTNPDENEQAADAAVEPPVECIAGTEGTAEFRRGPSDGQIIDRA